MTNRLVILTTTLLSKKVCQKPKSLLFYYLEYDLSVCHFYDLSDITSQIFLTKSIKFSQHLVHKYIENEQLLGRNYLHVTSDKLAS